MLIKSRIPKARIREEALILAPSPELCAHQRGALQELSRGKQVHYLNDAYFFAKETNLSLHGSVWHITDDRYLAKNIDRINQLSCLHISTLDSVVSIDHVRARGIAEVNRNLGRDGFCNQIGSAFHGCSVLHAALQYCCQRAYSKISILGAVMPPPSAYRRLSSQTTITLPQFVYFYQLRNIGIAFQRLREEGIALEILDPSSTLSFL